MAGTLFSVNPVNPINPWGANLPDPVIGTLTTGNVLDVQPFVSGDGKYITFGNINSQQTGLKDMFTEDIEAFSARTGYVRSWNPTGVAILPGEWSGKLDYDTKVKLNLGNKDVGLFKSYRIEKCYVNSFNFQSGKIIFTLNWNELGKNPRKTYLGKTLGEYVPRQVTINGIIGADGNSFVGTYSGPDESSGKIELVRESPEFPYYFNGDWTSDARECHYTWRSSSMATLNITINNKSSKCSLSLLKSFNIYPLVFDNKTRRFVCTVEIQRYEDKVKTRGIINGIFDPSLEKFRANIDCGTKMRGQLVFIK